MAAKKKTVFAEHKGVLYVQVAAVMHPLIPYMDGLAIVFFPRSKRAWMTVDSAIEWCKREITYDGHEKVPILKALQSAAEKFSAGKVTTA